MTRPVPTLLAAAAAMLVLAVPATVVAHDGPAGAVYTETNATSGNAVVAYARDASGALTPLGTYPTGGLGSGTGLGSQGAVILARGGSLLLAVNAGSNDVSSFAVADDGSLRLVGVTPAGGTDPISVTARGRYAYVLDAGGAGNIAGFTIADGGRLSPLDGSIQPLSDAGVAPAEVAFAPSGAALLVTEKGTNRLDSYAVDDSGRASAPVTTAAAGVTPFGFAFDARGHAFVSEAFGGAAGASTISSYGISASGASAIDPLVATTQTAACWVAITPDGRTLYDTNAGSDDLSAFSVRPDGSIQLEAARAGTVATGGHPTDLAISSNGRFVYVLDAGTDALSSFVRARDGSLVAIGTIAGLAPSEAGVAAR